MTKLNINNNYLPKSQLVIDLVVPMSFQIQTFSFKESVAPNIKSMKVPGFQPCRTDNIGYSKN